MLFAYRKKNIIEFKEVEVSSREKTTKGKAELEQHTGCVHYHNITCKA